MEKWKTLYNVDKFIFIKDYKSRCNNKIKIHMEGESIKGCTVYSDDNRKEKYEKRKQV